MCLFIVFLHNDAVSKIEYVNDILYYDFLLFFQLRYYIHLKLNIFRELVHLIFKKNSQVVLFVRNAAQEHINLTVARQAAPFVQWGHTHRPWDRPRVHRALPGHTKTLPGKQRANPVNLEPIKVNGNKLVVYPVQRIGTKIKRGNLLANCALEILSVSTRPRQRVSVGFYI